MIASRRAGCARQGKVGHSVEVAQEAGIDFHDEQRLHKVWRCAHTDDHAWAGMEPMWRNQRGCERATWCTHARPPASSRCASRREDGAHARMSDYGPGAPRKTGSAAIKERNEYIMRLTAQGLSQSQIATRLGIGAGLVNTVRREAKRREDADSSTDDSPALRDVPRTQG